MVKGKRTTKQTAAQMEQLEHSVSETLYHNQALGIRMRQTRTLLYLILALNVALFGLVVGVMVKYFVG
jgi:hypothetical protein